jgi:hypothetical protein
MKAQDEWLSRSALSDQDLGQMRFRLEHKAKKTIPKFVAFVGHQGQEYH